MSEIDSIPKLAGAVAVLTEAVGRLIARRPDGEDLLEKVEGSLDSLRDAVAKASTKTDNRVPYIAEMIDGAQTTLFELGNAAGSDDIGD
ncbi:hypothetical protein [Mycoplana rhizolycopersici]|uniref:Uncharacterized protein n=1 Tax=Mycoplana rhizolycopersici TaxID=2746702 RepID=A0ABX2QBY7_9HYPH|nr:hypothetical protein [Rhizobium rhizolycopersici]NVP54484.1 hypothetical protein [Rhizobium rhizolycopersici]